MNIKSKDKKSMPFGERIKYFFGTDAGLITGLIIIGGICFSFGHYVSDAASNKEISKINNDHKEKLNEYDQIISEKNIEIFNLHNDIYNLREKILNIQETSMLKDDNLLNKKDGQIDK